MEQTNPLLAIVAIVLYCAPSFVALTRRHRNLVPLILVNVTLGWTGIGWLAALVWSLWRSGDRPLSAGHAPISPPSRRWPF